MISFSPVKFIFFALNVALLNYFSIFTALLTLTIEPIIARKSALTGRLSYFYIPPVIDKDLLITKQ